MASISFDRAADYYDQTRSLSEGATAEMTALLLDELRARKLTLEIGVGTGRIAIPLVEAGVPMVGVDLAEKMLAVLRDKTSSIPIALGDATRLPFRDGSFDAAIACHVLHLIPEWRAALDELVRAVGLGGRILVNLGGWDHGVWREIEERFVREAGVTTPRPGASDLDEVDAVMAGHGATVRVLPEITDRRRVSYGELLDRIERGMYSFTWGADEAARKRGAAAVRAWVEAQHGSLDELHDKLWVVSWRAYDLPA